MQYLRALDETRFIPEIIEIKCGFSMEIGFNILKHIHRFCRSEKQIESHVNDFCDLEMRSNTKSLLSDEH